MTRSATEAELRRDVVATYAALETKGLNHGTAGNVGVRCGDGVLVTPTGMESDAVTADDIVWISADGVARANQRLATSEWRIHCDLLRQRRDVDAIVHTHSPEATAYATMRRPLPAIHYSIARAGGAPQVPCAAYATYGTAGLSANVAAALGDHGLAALMSSHGMVSLGTSLAAALSLAIEVEWLCGVHRRAIHYGDPAIIDDVEMAVIAEKFRTYGQSSSE